MLVLPFSLLLARRAFRFNDGRRRAFSDRASGLDPGAPPRPMTRSHSFARPSQPIMATVRTPMRSGTGWPLSVMLVSGKTTRLTSSVFSTKPMAEAPKTAEKPVSMMRATSFVCCSGAS